MPSLTKDSRDRSPYWFCCYTSATGQHLKKTTKITVKPLPGETREDGTPKTPADKKKEALEFCLTLERTENSAKAGTLTEQAAKKYIAEILERTSGARLRESPEALRAIAGLHAAGVKLKIGDEVIEVEAEVLSKTGDSQTAANEYVS